METTFTYTEPAVAIAPKVAPNMRVVEYSVSGDCKSVTLRIAEKTNGPDMGVMKSVTVEAKDQKLADNLQASLNAIAATDGRITGLETK